jgi:hypothetical protein
VTKPEPAKARGKVDWSACEADFRTGTYSNCQLAAKYECSESAIRDRAKRYEWRKDLSDAVRKATSAKLLRADLREPNAQKDAAIVEEAADVRMGVVLRHRKDIGKLDALKGKLIEKAEAVIEAMTSLDNLVDAAQVIESLGRTQSRLIPLERQAFSLDTGSPEGGVTITISPAESEF